MILDGPCRQDSQARLPQDGPLPENAAGSGVRPTVSVRGAAGARR